MITALIKSGNYLIYDSNLRRTTAFTVSAYPRDRTELKKEI